MYSMGLDSVTLHFGGLFSPVVFLSVAKSSFFDDRLRLHLSVDIRTHVNRLLFGIMHV